MTSPAPACPRPPVALSIAGTDPSGGAGIHADLKAFTARAVYGTTVITALVAQNTHGVSRVYPIDTDFVADQFDSVLDDMPVDASKTGMLGSRELVELAVDRAARTRKDGRSHLGFLTVDPVMVATSGHRLLERDAVSAVRDLLTPVAQLITPNIPEAALLLGDDVPEAADVSQQRAQAVELVRRGSRAVLLKGGHMLGDRLVDVLAVAAATGTATGTSAATAPWSGEWTRDGDVVLREFHHRRIATPHTHGTGCTLSAAITAETAAAVQAGRDMSSPDAIADAVATALAYLARAIRSGSGWRLAYDPEGAHGPVDHVVDLTIDGRGQHDARQHDGRQDDRRQLDGRQGDA
ncbi:bifunctional hydroxymethylpyrimidine kinase/phosphomethylpyrimidine kinase [Brevibacterium jeotgali]|uniref:Hydroxymethylpyrimidine/phosphomethylpyrimidine kinase n=1 Tax=Brevibacterium jeotgali TaxID=1262550 RepID=A0A2H1L5Z9_9MICO|nr:bifunctional hydroxymethylpyrimidine kinase/phosphomethylpyrimidine kinase [Brevibacterium jeotgali]TWB98871.1 hydroxymethylpyrimidine/phosphomethylpyrimidine kinase [Brevibacterium jeotgali]SMY12299.1 hydroxymethylpyrimidine/phosphomethylpyrimidine kinase [Brevibacterium jeotgali]